MDVEGLNIRCGSSLCRPGNTSLSGIGVLEKSTGGTLAVPEIPLGGTRNQ